MEIEELSIGDSIPFEFWNLPLQLVNHPSGKETITLDDYKDKLIILDFWATWCSSCIKNFPKVEALQREHDQDLKVLLVNSKSTRDTHEKVSEFLTIRKDKFNLPSIVEDTILNKLFPHTVIPHYVWIKDRRLITITEAEDLTKENIHNLFAGEPIKSSFAARIEYDSRSPLFEDGNGGDAPAYLHKSMLTPFLNGLKSSMSHESGKHNLISRITFTNARVLNLYRYAYPEFYNLSQARFFLEVIDAEAFAPDSSSLSWRNKNLFNYEAQFPPCSVERAKEIMRTDLRRYFGYQVYSEVRELDCWIVKTKDRSLAAYFSGDLKSETNLYDDDGEIIFYNNSPIEYLITELESRYKQPFIDETGIKEPVKLNLPSNLLDSAELQKHLDRQGLLLSKEKRKIDVVILSDKN